MSFWNALARCARVASIPLVVVAVLAGVASPAWAVDRSTVASPFSSSRGEMTLVEGVGMGRRPSARVRSLQRMLVRHGFGVGRSGVDGRFGPVTAAAVRRLQSVYGLAVDGVVGPKTGRLLALLDARSRASRPPPARPRPRVRLLKPEVQRTAKRPPRSPAPGAATATWALLALAVALMLAVVLVARMARGSAAATTRREKAEKADPRAVASGPPVAGRRPPADADPSLAGATPPASRPILGYLVGPEDSGDRAAKANAMKGAAHCAGYEVVDVVHDRDSTVPALERPGLAEALRQIAAGRAEGLLVADLLRACRSLADLATLVRWFAYAEVTLVALDLGVDTSTPGGRHAAWVLSRLGEWERERAARANRQLAPAHAHPLAPPLEPRREPVRRTRRRA